MHNEESHVHTCHACEVGGTFVVHGSDDDDNDDDDNNNNAIR